jgi:aspartate 1-decarboxylase
MLIKVLKGKLHRGTVTDSKLHYPGSVGIDPDLYEAAGIVPYEHVLIADLNNGNRLETYVVPAERGSGHINILGAAAQLIKQGDLVIIMAFGLCTPEEAHAFRPKVVVLGTDNEVLEKPGD